MTESVAIERVRKFIVEWRKPSGNRDPESIYGLHFGHEREAELTAADLETLLADRDHWLKTAALMGSREARAVLNAPSSKDQ